MRAGPSAPAGLDTVQAAGLAPLSEEPQLPGPPASILSRPSDALGPSRREEAGTEPGTGRLTCAVAAPGGLRSGGWGRAWARGAPPCAGASASASAASASAVAAAAAAIHCGPGRPSRAPNERKQRRRRSQAGRNGRGPAPAPPPRRVQPSAERRARPFLPPSSPPSVSPPPSGTSLLWWRIRILLATF